MEPVLFSQTFTLFYDTSNVSRTRTFRTPSKMPKNFSFVLPGRLAGSALPSSVDEAQEVCDAGIKTIVNLREEEYPPEIAAVFDAAGVTRVHLPVADFQGAPLDAMDALEKLVISCDTHPVLIHCQKGIGRTGLMLAVAVCALTEVDPALKEEVMACGSGPQGESAVVMYLRTKRNEVLMQKTQMDSYRAFEAARVRQ